MNSKKMLSLSLFQQTPLRTNRPNQLFDVHHKKRDEVDYCPRKISDLTTID